MSRAGRSVCRAGRLTDAAQELGNLQRAARRVLAVCRSRLGVRTGADMGDDDARPAIGGGHPVGGVDGGGEVLGQGGLAGPGGSLTGIAIGLIARFG